MLKPLSCAGTAGSLHRAGQSLFIQLLERMPVQAGELYNMLNGHQPKKLLELMDVAVSQAGSGSQPGNDLGADSATATTQTSDGDTE